VHDDGNTTPASSGRSTVQWRLLDVVRARVTELTRELESLAHGCVRLADHRDVDVFLVEVREQVSCGRVPALPAGATDVHGGDSELSSSGWRAGRLVLERCRRDGVSERRCRCGGSAPALADADAAAQLMAVVVIGGVGVVLCDVTLVQ